MKAYAKVNLALVVGKRREDGLHEVASVLQRIDLADELALAAADELSVDGFAEDTLVRDALLRLAEAAGVEARWRVRIEKRIPVAAGLGGGSADAAAALLLANRTLAEPLPAERLRAVAAATGMDVPFFLEPGPKLAEGAGERLAPLDVPQDYSVVIALPPGARKAATAEVYRRFDELGGGAGFEARRAALAEVIARCRRPLDLALLPPNDLAEAAGRPALADELLGLGAFRADLTGAGPAVCALFERRSAAEAGVARLAAGTRAWIADPVW